MVVFGKEKGGGGGYILFVRSFALDSLCNVRIKT